MLYEKQAAASGLVPSYPHMHAPAATSQRPRSQNPSTAITHTTRSHDEGDSGHRVSDRGEEDIQRPRRGGNLVRNAEGGISVPQSSHTEKFMLKLKVVDHKAAEIT